MILRTHGFLVLSFACMFRTGALIGEQNLTGPAIHDRLPRVHRMRKDFSADAGSWTVERNRGA